MNSIIFYILITLAIIAIIEFIVLLRNLSLYFNEKRNTIAFDNNNKADDLKYSSLNLGKRLKITNSLLDFIDELVEEEITLLLVRLARLQSHYEVMNMEKDIKDISTKIFDAIKDTGVIDNKDLIVSTDYFLEYITSNVSSKLIVATTDFNDRLDHPETMYANVDDSHNMAS
jgi:hypothetical protein